MTSQHNSVKIPENISSIDEFQTKKTENRNSSKHFLASYFNICNLGRWFPTMSCFWPITGVVFATVSWIATLLHTLPKNRNFDENKWQRLECNNMNAVFVETTHLAKYRWMLPLSITLVRLAKTCLDYSHKSGIVVFIDFNLSPTTYFWCVLCSFGMLWTCVVI